MSVQAKKDYIYKKVLVDGEPQLVVLLPKTTTDCVYLENQDTTLEEYLKDLKLNEPWLGEWGIIIKDNVVAETSTYSSHKIEQIAEDLRNNTTIDGLEFSVENGNLVVTYDDGEV